MIDAATGRPIAEAAHLAQSCRLILETPVGTRVARRDFGSVLLDLVDQPADRLTAVRLYGAIASALGKWEPRLRLRQVAISAGGAPGRFVVELDGERTDTPAPNALVRLKVPIATRAAPSA